MLIIKLGENMRNFNGYRYIVISMFFIVLLVGSFLGCKFVIKSTKSDEIIKETVPVVNNEDNKNNEVNIYEREDQDIEVVYEDFYSVCGETIRDSQIHYSTNLNKVKDEELKKQRSENKEYSIAQETDERLVFKRTINGNCPSHYTLKLEDGAVVIYNRIDKENLEVYKKLNIAEELIREELKERLKEGIDVDSKEELNLIVEDLES